MHLRRREFVSAVSSAALLAASEAAGLAADKKNLLLEEIHDGEGVLQYIDRSKGKFDRQTFRKILGAANEFKEGDQIVGVAAIDDRSRLNARRLLARTTIGEIDQHPIHDDELSRFIGAAPGLSSRVKSWTLARLKSFLLASDEHAIKELSRQLSSDVIACVVKLMDNSELIRLSARVFNPLPGTRIGAKGFLGARIQPNSPTDNLDDIRWQVFDGFSYAVGDVLLGTNPVSSEVKSVLAIEETLQEILRTFNIQDAMPHCVLSHIDVQAAAEEKRPNSTALWFQSIGGVDNANQTFDISVEKMKRHAQRRSGRYGLYFETGQGADFTNGHGQGFDMVMHESRKYGFARSLTRIVANAQRAAGKKVAPWVHLNDVAGFIGPEVFRTREQLVRCCLEDLVMGKLHGLCIGLDVCSTLHMDVSLADLDWCLEKIMPANPAYLMALPTKIDPMLGYLTTGYQDHVRLREKFGFRVNPPMWDFFKRLGVIDSSGRATKRFGDPLWVYLQFQRAQQDKRSDAAILAEGRSQMAEVKSRGVFLASGYGETPGKLAPALKKDIERIYVDAKESIWTELDEDFVRKTANVLPLSTNSKDRTDYILHPQSGETLDRKSMSQVLALKAKHGDKYNLQIVVSDGLNAQAIMDQGHLQPFLSQLRELLSRQGFRVSPDNMMVRSGRVRAGYRIGEALFQGRQDQTGIVHVIGERPGSGHHTFSAYITAPSGGLWSQPGKVDHNITKVVSGIASTALQPTLAAEQTASLLKSLR